jgi:hypothetical protein
MNNAFWAVTLVLLALSGCRGAESAAEVKPLSGVWVDTETRMDTLRFSKSGSRLHLSVGRGFEFRDGALLPKIGAGVYEYALPEDGVIAVRAYLSSNSAFQQVTLVQGDSILSIEPFWEPAATGYVILKRL